MKGILKLFFSLVSLLLVVVLVMAAWFGFQGYHMYQDAVKETPISEKVESIRSMENFTQYEGLPEIYVKAVVSVEDKRFWEQGHKATAWLPTTLLDR